MASLALAACGSFERGERLPSSGDAHGGDPAASAFATDVHPILVDVCQRCHGQGGAASGTDLLLTGNAQADYNEVVDFVNPQAPDASVLLTKARGQGHGGGAPLPSDSEEYAVVRAWIAAGAAP